MLDVWFMMCCVRHVMWRQQCTSPTFRFNKNMAYVMVYNFKEVMSTWPPELLHCDKILLVDGEMSLVIGTLTERPLEHPFVALQMGKIYYIQINCEQWVWLSWSQKSRGETISEKGILGVAGISKKVFFCLNIYCHFFKKLQRLYYISSNRATMCSAQHLHESCPTVQ